MKLHEARTQNDLLAGAIEYEEQKRAERSLSFMVGCALTDADVRHVNEKGKRRNRRANDRKYRQRKFWN